MPYAAINDVMDTLNHEHVRARGMVTQVQHKECGRMSLVSPPVKYSESKTPVRSAPPMLGEHTDEVLMGLLGMGRAEVSELREKGVVA